MYGNPDIRILEIFACGIWNPGDVCLRNPEPGKEIRKRNPALEPGIQLNESGIPLKSAIRNPRSTDNIHYSVPGLEIHGVEFRDSKTVFDTLTWGDSKVK